MSVLRAVDLTIGTIGGLVLYVAAVLGPGASVAANGPKPEQGVPESNIIKKVRDAEFYKYVGRGKITLSPHAKETLDEFERRSDSGLFFLTEDGQDGYKTWCSYACDEWGNAFYVKRKCEQYFGKKCFLYKIGVNAFDAGMNEFKETVVWDFWVRSGNN